MAEQPRLFEFRMGERAPETHVVTRANQAAVERLEGWRAWPGGALALTGPQGAGKTHLAHVWAAATGARFIDKDFSPEAAAEAFAAAEGRLVVDDADRAAEDQTLNRLLDLARWRQGAVLLIGQDAPSRWPRATADLVSRLKALPAARLEEPDEMLLELVLRRLCRERFIELSDKAASYLATHMTRTFASAHALAAELDRSVEKAARPVSVPQAKKALEALRADQAAQEGGGA
ncbi:MAG: DNA replication protein [Hyphomonadaceae bacterium]